MKAPHSTPNPAAEEQAALWAARLDGASLSAADQAALETWLAADPSHRALLSDYCQFSADLEEQLPLLVATGAVAMPAEKPPGRARFAWFSGLALAAAAAMLFAFWLGLTEVAVEKIATPIAQRQTRTLPDGSRIDLNANTSLVVENTATERRVRLASGEAFFSVSKDTARPFIVDTPAGSVRVTGTAFNVRSEITSQLEVTVAEGSVQVRPSAASNGSASALVALTAGERLIANPDNVKTEKLAPAALEDALAWRQGRAVFAGTRLEEAAARFARYHGRGIQVIGAAKEKSVGARYHLDDLKEFLDSLPESFGVVVTHEPNGTVLISPRAAVGR